MPSVLVRDASIAWLCAAILLSSPVVAQPAAPELEYLRFEPVASFGDGADEMTVEARVTGSLTSVRARDPRGFLSVDGVPLEAGEEFDLDQIGPELWARSGLIKESTRMR